jgi:hypothetical protein
MKSGKRYLTILLMLALFTILFTKQLSAQESYVSYQVFYDQLSPYGQWLENPDYGYVWIPEEGSDFVPYSSMGHWILSVYGWTWVSYYSWGWAPFHYGRWDFDNYYGWFWIPDNEWGPAWVTWRRSDGYYGWAPMEPGISIQVSFGRQYNNRNDHWIFVRDRDIDRSNISSFFINRNDNERIIRNSTVINNTYVDDRRNTTYVTGPDRSDMQKVTGRRINPVPIEESTGPGQEMRNGLLRIYRPQVNRNVENGRKAEPSRVVALRDVKRPSERTPVNLSGNPKQPDNNIQRRQPAEVAPQNEAKPLQQQNNNRTGINKRDVQQNAVTPQNNVRSLPQQNDNRAGTNREVQQNSATQQNSTKSLQRQNDNPTRNSRAQKQSSVKPSKNTGSEQPKKSGSEKNQKKKNDKSSAPEYFMYR